MIKEPAEVSKDLVFAQPREPVKRFGYEDTVGAKTQPRDWTLAEIEEVMWRIRASGGTDSTPIVLSYRQEDSIRAKHVEAFPIEIPRRRHEPTCKACDDAGVLDSGKACPVCQHREDAQQWWYRPAQVTGVLLALPLLLAMLVLAWSFFFSVF